MSAARRAALLGLPILIAGMLAYCIAQALGLPIIVAMLLGGVLGLTGSCLGRWAVDRDDA